MTNKEMLENIEYLRERANVTYEEAEQLLNQYDGNVMQVLVEMEKQGRVYNQAGAAAGSAAQENNPMDEGMQKAKSFFHNAMNTHLIVEQKTGDKQKKVAEVPVPFAVIGALAAPWLTVVAAGIGLATGHTAKVKKTEETEDKS